MTINAFGDSVTNGTAGTSIRYPVVAASILGQSLNNYGIGGSMIADQVASIFGNAKQDSFFLTGLNDLLYFGSSTVDYEKILKSCLVYLASGEIVKGQNMTKTGSWTNSGIYGANISVMNNTLNDSVSCSVTGTIVYVSLTQINNGTGGLAEIWIDGNLMTSCGCYGNTAPQSGLAYSPTLLRFAGLSSGSHTVEIKNISTASNNCIWVDYVASNTVGNKICVGGVLPSTNAAYAACVAPVNHGSQTNCAAYGTLISNDCSLFSADGLDIRYVNLNTYDPAVLNVINDVHPNLNGQCYLAVEFLLKYFA